MKDLSNFYSVVAGVCFTLLGLWWVVVHERPDLRQRELKGGRMAYAVSLQFVLPGTAALLSQVAPEIPALWRTAFVAAGIAGATGIVLLAPTLAATGGRTTARLLLSAGVPLYLAITVVAARPQIASSVAGSLTGAQLEGVLFCLLMLLGAQTAWTAAMTTEALDQVSS